MDVHPDAVITEDFYLDANEVVHVVIGQEEEEKLVALQKILNENDWVSLASMHQSRSRKEELIFLHAELS